MKTRKQWLSTIILMVTFASAQAADYLTFLTPERGFVEITDAENLSPGTDYLYILTAAETQELIVGVGAYEDKPSWATLQTKALRYISAETDPLLEKSNFFYLEKNGGYIGFRNMVYSADCFQTHRDAGFMYVNTFTDKQFDEWSLLIPSFQDDYWLFESGKYPLAEDNYYAGYLGPWNKSVAVGEAIALNRKNTADDEAGHYRIFRISKTDFQTLFKQEYAKRLYAASASQPIDATWLITNPSFESGDVTGWVRSTDVTDDPEIGVRGDYTMTNEEGGYLFNAYQWWASTLFVKQEVQGVPCGEYELSAVLATWNDRVACLRGNNNCAEITSQGDQTGIPVSIPVKVGVNGRLIITAGSSAQWWVDGHGGETQTFFKVDDVRLTCKGLYLDGYAIPLPNNDNTLLTPGQWYYYDVPVNSPYLLRGKLSDLVCCTDGMASLDQVVTQAVTQRMALNVGRIYFKTSQANVTLSITPEREMEEGSFTAVALNVDGLPQKIALVTVNKDGPGSEGSQLISQYIDMKQYDMLGLSEDFNYNGSLMSAINQDYECGTVRATISIEDIGFPFDTDGLNVFWKKSKIQMDNETWTKWNTTTSTDGNQYVKKGYRHYDMTVDDKLVVDLYVLHMDAGDVPTSRETQWVQLAEAIKQADTSRPKLVIGDTNSRWTREQIKSKFFDQLTDNYVVSDTWVELCRNNDYPNTSMEDMTDEYDPTQFGFYEVVDKIIYLNPKGENTTQLVPKSFRIEQDYLYGTVDGTDNDKQLGDHRPVVVEFGYILSGDAKHVIGDVNRDGQITVSDVMATVDIILGMDSEEPYIYDHFAADANQDGTISVADAMAIVDYILTH